MNSFSLRSLQNILIVRNSNFRLLWLSQMVSQTGNRMFQLSVIWWAVTTQSQSTGLFLGAFLVSSVLPGILLTKWVGRVVTESSPRKLLRTCDLFGGVASLALAGLTYVFELNFPLVIFFNFLFSICQSLITPTLNKSVSQLVDDTDVGEAMAFVSSTQSFANFTGALIGALLIERLGLFAIIMLNGASYVFAGVCDALIRFGSQKLTQAKSDRSRPFVLQKKLKQILMSFGAINFFLTPLLMILPLYVARVLTAEANTLALLEACVWIGMLVGTFSRWLLPFPNRTLQMISYCLGGIALSLAVPGFFPDLMKTYPGTYGLFLFLTTVLLGRMNVRIMTLFQSLVTPEDKAHFFARLQAVISVSLPLSYFCFGISSDHLSIPTLCLIQAAGVLVFAIKFRMDSQNDDVITETVVRVV